MFDETTGKPVVIPHPLTFPFIPEMLPKNRGQITMANGGLLPFGETSTEEEDADTNLLKLQTRIDELEKKAKLNVQQPIGKDEGDDAQNEGVDAGIGTPESMMEGIAGLIGGIGSLGVFGAVQGMIGMHQQQEEVDTAVAAGHGTTDSEGNTTSTTAMGTEADPVDVTGHDPSQTGFTGLIGMHDVSDEAIQGQIDAATAQVAEEEAVQEAADVGVVGQDEADATAAGVGGVGSADDGEDATGEATGEGYKDGAMVEGQADTTMDTAGLGPMGLVDDMAGDQVTGVEDDLNMEVEEGAYVLNADTVELIGLKDLNQLTKDAIDIAIESDIPLPKSVDPTQKVPIKISNGEFVVPAILVPIIGLENLEKMNKRGLEYREKNTEEAPPQEAQQQDVPVEPSEVPSRGVPGEINLAQGGALADQMNQLM
jgi:hypothetical protein